MFVVFGYDDSGCNEFSNGIELGFSHAQIFVVCVSVCVCVLNCLEHMHIFKLEIIYSRFRIIALPLRHTRISIVDGAIALLVGTIVPVRKPHSIIRVAAPTRVFR